MTFVIVGSLVTACLLFLQGIHILRKGNMRPFFKQPDLSQGSHPTLKLGNRFAGAIIYTIPGLAIVCILIAALFRNGVHSFYQWLSSHIVGLFGGLFLFTYGLVALLRPDVVIRWVASAHPDYDLAERNPSMQYFVRVLGVFVSGFALFVFSNL